MESRREIQLQISSRSISEGNSKRHPLPYPIGRQKFTMENSHIVHTPAGLPEHPISYPIFTPDGLFWVVSDGKTVKNDAFNT